MRELNKDEFDVKKEQYIDKLAQELPKVSPTDAKIADISKEQLESASNVIAKAMYILLQKMLSNNTDNMFVNVSKNNINVTFKISIEEIIKENNK